MGEIQVPGWLQLVLPATCALGAFVSWWCWLDARRRFRDGKALAIAEAAAKDADLWHGRCVHLQRVVTALLAGNRPEARRLIAESMDEGLMAQVGAAERSEKC